ncbi:MAG: DNA methyltransferase [Aggregatilineales bacterium]
MVEYVFNQLHLSRESWVYDPFSGSGTTLLCAQQAGINAYGVEAHSFVHWASGVKLYRDYDCDHLERQLARLVAEARACVTSRFGTTDLTGIFPDLVYKCYHARDLTELYLLREYILSVENQPLRDLLKLALTDVLRGAAAPGTGWPYISPRKNTGDKPPKGDSSLFERTVWRMYRDLRNVVRLDPSPVIQNILGDSRQRQALMTAKSTWR